MLTDAGYLEARLAEIGGPGARLASHERDDSGQVRFTTRQFLPAAALPSAVRGMVGDQLRINRTETWHAAESDPINGTVSAEVVGSPGSLTGRMALSGDGGSSELAIRLEATVALPLVGGKVEAMALENIQKLLDAEHRFTTAWLRDAG